MEMTETEKFIEQPKQTATPGITIQQALDALKTWATTEKKSLLLVIGTEPIISIGDPLGQTLIIETIAHNTRRQFGLVLK